ncbi:hydrolase [Intrasporangium oryzae NRRL B-24470]|uniref:Hydrolase n=1 Tax=Intrasporangium oryzae NRRL B-24470 TaxID=1386089 RepID=W9G0R5_9MICO|nr:hydrolase [Intrasporangium oryzae NRRL B-24470]
MSAAYDGIVCDLDGVVYRGAGAVRGVPDALQQLAAQGKGIVYATNNASRVPAEVAAQLAELGAPSDPHQVVTSAEAGAARLAQRLAPRSAVLALGGPGVALALEAAGLTPVAPDEACGDGGTRRRQAVVAVLQGFGRDLTVRDFEAAARQLADGVVWVATNGDTTLPLEWGSAPGNGAYVALLSGVVGRQPEVVGKPERPLYDLAVGRLGTRPERTLAVGDRLDTDIAGAVAASLDSAWVLSGVNRPSDLLAAPATCRPTYVVRDLGALLEPYAVPRDEGERWVCGGARIRLTADDLVVEERDADGIEAVRAGLGALVAERARGMTAVEDLVRLAHALDALGTS